jgi:hypothetical protein
VRGDGKTSVSITHDALYDLQELKVILSRKWGKRVTLEEALRFAVRDICLEGMRQGREPEVGG